MKPVLVVTAVVLALVAVAVAGNYARDRQQEARATPTVAAVGTPVEALQDCPWGEALCILAQGLDRALEHGDINAVIDLAEPVTHICPGRAPAEPGGPFPLCDGVPENESRRGYTIGRRYSEGAVVNEAALRAFINRFMEQIAPGARDAIGSGELELYSLTCSREAFPIQNVSCARPAVVFSAILGPAPDQQRRELLIFWAVPGFQGETLPITEVWTGIVLGEEVPVLFQTGGRLFDLGVVHVLDR